MSHISQLAYHRKALVVLDEVNVFVQARSTDGHQNARVSVFLRYRVSDSDDVTQSRITLAVRNEPF